MRNFLIRSVSVLIAILGSNTFTKAQTLGPLGSPAAPPIGFVQFCRTNPADCVNQTRTAENIRLTEESWQKIVRINAEVNREITMISDQDHWGEPEVWSYPTDGKGDCEDFVLEKRRRLAALGFPLQALLITVVRDLNGEGHAVLTVKTDRGDFILDNQVGKIIAWNETGYRYIKRQSQENPTRWVSLGGIDTTAVAAAR